MHNPYTSSSSVLPQAPNNSHMTMAPYPYLPQTSSSPNAVKLTSLGGEAYIKQSWQTQPSQMPLSSAYNQFTTPSAMTEIEPVEMQAHALKTGKTKLPISVDDHKSGHGRWQKKKSIELEMGTKERRTAANIGKWIDKQHPFQPGNWWLTATHDWYPFIVSRGRTNPNRQRGRYNARWSCKDNLGSCHPAQQQNRKIH